MKKDQIIFGIIFLVIFVLQAILLTVAGFPIHLLWFSNHWALLLAIAAFSRSTWLLSAELCIGLIPEIAYMIDFTIESLTGSSLWGSTSYMFSPDYSPILYAQGMFHFAILPLAILLFIKWGVHPHAWIAALAHALFILTISHAFPQFNINCSQQACASWLSGIQPYYIMYPFVGLIAIMYTQQLLIWLDSDIISFQN